MADIYIAQTFGLHVADFMTMTRPYEQQSDGTFTRRYEQVEPIKYVADGLNHLEGKSCRTVFSSNHPPSTMSNVGSNALYQFCFHDNVVNARRRVYRVLSMPVLTSETTGTQTDWIGTDSAGKQAISTSKSTSIFPNDCFVTSFTYTRGAATNSMVYENIVTNGYFRVLDICAQERQLAFLDTSIHDGVDTFSVTKGAPIVSNITEEIRAKNQRLRETNNEAQVASWSAYAQGGNWVYPATSGANGIVVSCTSYLNLIDGTSTVRGNSSPGFTCSGYGKEVGFSNTVKVRFAVHAHAQGSNGNIRVIGPPNLPPPSGSNQYDFAIRTDLGATWYNATSLVYLCPTILDSDETVNRNKFDVFGAVDSSAGNITVWGVRAWIEY